MTTATLTLILPPWPEPAPGRLPALEKLLARAERDGQAAADLQRGLLQRCGVEVDADSDVPVAALCRLADGGRADDGYWLRADPVHLVADQDRVYLAAMAPELPVRAEEASRLADEFNALFGADGWQLQPLHPQRWYLRLPGPAGVRTTAPVAALGCDIRPLLPRGREAMAWHAALNEIQMLLHGSAVNRQRELAGEPPINSLWLWGGGVVPAALHSPWQRICSNDCYLHGLALAAGVPWGPTPAGLNDLGTVAAATLVELERAAPDWPELERNWFAPLLRALQRGEVARAELYQAGSSASFVLERRHARRWWRRRPPGIGGGGQ